MENMVHLKTAILVPIVLISCNALSTISGNPPSIIATSSRIEVPNLIESPNQSTRLQIPPTGFVYHGIYPGQTTGQESGVTLKDLQEYEDLAGKKAAWVYFSNEWFEGREFPLYTASWIRDYGSVPFIRLMLRTSSEQNKAEPVFTPQSIADGKFDGDLQEWCRSARDFVYPLLVEYGTEVNGQWFPWNGVWHGEGESGNYGDPAEPDGPERFRNAYRHIIQTCRNEGVENITWVFHINTNDNPSEEWNAFENYYPGDEWIDWIAVSLYGAQTPLDEESEIFRSGIDTVYPRIEQMAPDKPVVIAEFGVTRDNPHVDQAEWARNALSDITTSRWPRIIGFSWWNEGWQNDENPAHDTTMRLQDNPQLVSVFQEMAGNNPVVLDSFFSAVSAGSKEPDMTCEPTETEPVTTTGILQPSLMDMPAPRSPFRDPVLGTCLVRVTDREVDFQEDLPVTGFKNEYSRVQSFNANETVLLARSLDAAWYTYDTRTFKPLKKLPFEGPVDPRWSATDPDVLFFFDGAQLRKCNIHTLEVDPVHDFSGDFPGQNISTVWTRYEGSPSYDGNTWGLMAEDENWLTSSFLVYDLPSNRVTARLDIRSWPDEAREIDSVTMSPLGNYFLVYMDKYCETGQTGTMDSPCGLMVFDRELRTARGLLRLIGHSDTASDEAGREVLVYQDIDTDSISMLDMASGLIQPLWPIDFSQTTIGLHFSGRASLKPGWALVSTYGSDPVMHTWMDHKVFAIELKPGGRVVQLAFTRSLVDESVEKDYWAEPQATVNKDFSKILFSSNWDQTGDDKVEMYAVLLNNGWMDTLP